MLSPALTRCISYPVELVGPGQLASVGHNIFCVMIAMFFAWWLSHTGCCVLQCHVEPGLGTAQQLMPCWARSCNSTAATAYATIAQGDKSSTSLADTAVSGACLQTCFGRVVGIGKAGGAGPWGASVSCMPWIQGICLDLLPSSWQEAADLEKVRN